MHPMLAILGAGSAALVSLACARAPLPFRPAVSPRQLSPVCVETEVASALANLDPSTLGAVGAGLLALGGAFVAAGKKDDGKEVASPPPSVAPPPPASVAPPPPATKAVEQWPERGGSGGPHRMSGTWPKEPPRELYWLPRGGSGGYHRMAGRKLPVDEPKVALLSPLPTNYKFIPKTQSLPADFMADMKAMFGSKRREWPQRGGGGSYHRMAGRLGKPVVVAAAPTAAAAPAAAPAAAAAPKAAAPAAASAGVKSWYDAGVPMK